MFGEESRSADAARGVEPPGCLADSELPLFEVVEEIVANSRPTRPADVVLALQQRYPARSWQLVKSQELWRTVGSAEAADGKLIAADANAWLKQEGHSSCARDALAATIQRDGIVFCRKEILLRYAIGIDPAHPMDFVQIRFFVETKLLCSLQNIEPWHLGKESDSYLFPWDEAQKLAPSLTTSSENIVHSLRWLERCKAAHKIKCEHEFRRLQGLVVRRHLPSGGLSPPVPLLEYEPELATCADRLSREERWFNDWARSSAGKLPMGEHWYLDPHDHTDKEGLRHIGFIPRAVVWPRNKVKAKGKSPARLMDELARFDHRVRHSFGWFFHMAYGNRVSDAVGETIAEGIRQGEIHLPASDEAILMAWIADPYRF